MKSKLKRLIVYVLCICALMVAFGIHYVRSHPLVFNESFLEHAHCILMADGQLQMYAHDHQGRFPYHTNGYGDAILLIPNVWVGCFSGPGYDDRALEKAQKTGGHIPDSMWGRVYVQGFTTSNCDGVAILFDKVSSPGDHTHFFSRITAPFGREVLGAGDGFVLDSEWPQFASNQIKLLVAKGIPPKTAEAYYADTLKK